MARSLTVKRSFECEQKISMAMSEGATVRPVSISSMTDGRTFDIVPSGGGTGTPVPRDHRLTTRSGDEASSDRSGAASRPRPYCPDIRRFPSERSDALVVCKSERRDVSDASYRNTLVTRTPRSVSMRISSPRATRRPLEVSSTGAGVTAQLDDVPRLEVGQPAQREVDAAQLDGQRDGDVERGDLGRGRGRIRPGGGLAHRSIFLDG